MDETYNFTLGPAILSLMTESQLREMAEKDYPFLRNSSERAAFKIRNARLM